MRLLKFECRGFRCLHDLCIEPTSGANIIRGKNAQGKTSVLEALLFVATSKSHRTTQERDLVQYDHDSFRIVAQAQRSDREVTLEANWWQGAKRFKVNGVSQTRVSEILGKINVVMFSPEDVFLVKGTAAGRRRFLDMELSQLYPQYLNALQQYRQVLRQRNELLRSPKANSDMLDVWDEQLSCHGSVLIKLRAEFIDQLASYAREAYGQIADAEELEISYHPNVGANESLTDALIKGRDSDIRRGMSTRGPHRDDLEFLVSGKAARNFASQGQQKTASLALKLAELELVKTRTGEYPILMLDEVLAELDDNRAQHLFKTIDNGVQCLITTTDMRDRKTVFGDDCMYYIIERGKLEKQK